MGGLISKDEIIEVQIYRISPQRCRGTYSVKIKWKSGKIETLYDSHESMHMRLAEYKKKQGSLSVSSIKNDISDYQILYKDKSIISDEWISLDEALMRFKVGYSYYISVKPRPEINEINVTTIQDKLFIENVE